jgi:hypothetical protein
MTVSRFVFDHLRDFPRSEIATVIPLFRKIPQTNKSLANLTRKRSVLRSGAIFGLSCIISRLRLLRTVPNSIMALASSVGSPGVGGTH